MTRNRSRPGTWIRRLPVVFALVSLRSHRHRALVNVVVDGDEAVADRSTSWASAPTSRCGSTSQQNLDGAVAGTRRAPDQSARPLLARASRSPDVDLAGDSADDLGRTAGARGLAFSNVTEVELHTAPAPVPYRSPIRLYKAQRGGPFHDITNDISSGSVRVRGRTGVSHDFLLVVDLMPRFEAAQDKYAFLDALILTGRDGGVRAQLQADLAAAAARSTRQLCAGAPRSTPSRAASAECRWRDPEPLARGARPGERRRRPADRSRFAALRAGPPRG